MARWTTKQVAGKAKAKTPIKKLYPVMIGIDPGTHTGLAIKYDGNIQVIKTMSIIEAIETVNEWCQYHGKHNVLIRIEDARQRQFFGNSGPEKWKGAGSIRRDCAIWEVFL